MQPPHNVFSLSEEMNAALMHDPLMRELWLDGAEREALALWLRQREQEAEPTPPPPKPVQPSNGFRPEVRLRVSSDELKAWVELPAALRGCDEQELTYLIHTAIKKGGVISGIRRRQMARLAKSPVFNTPILVAVGKAPPNLGAGPVQFHVEPCVKLDLLPGGGLGVDPKEPDFYRPVKAKTLLCTYIPQDTGDGWTVRGAILPGLCGQESRLTAGKGIGVSPDGKYRALIDGDMTFQNGVLSVVPVLHLSSLEPSAGSIHFPGSVYVDGNLESGCVLDAKGNVAVGGNIGDCHLTVGGHLAVGRGIAGGPRCTIRVGGCLRAPFLENVRAKVSGNVLTDVIYGSTVRCEGIIRTLGRRGRISGSTCVARELVAKEIGTESGTLATVEITSLLPLRESLAEAEAEEAAWLPRMEELSTAIDKSEALSKKASLQNLLYQMETHHAKAEAKATRLRERLKRLESAYAPEIRAEVIHAGVVCTVFGKRFNPDRPYVCCRVFFNGNAIITEPLHGIRL